jgi:hypothetical protein
MLYHLYKTCLVNKISHPRGSGQSSGDTRKQKSKVLHIEDLPSYLCKQVSFAAMTTSLSGTQYSVQIECVCLICNDCIVCLLVYLFLA